MIRVISLKECAAGAIGLVVALVAGCAISPGSRPEVAPPAVNYEESSLIREALTRAVIDGKDIPRYSHLVKHNTVMVLSTLRSGQTKRSLVPLALPRGTAIEFLLVTYPRLKELARFRGRVSFLSVEIRAITPDSARIALETNDLSYTEWPDTRMWHHSEWYYSSDGSSVVRGGPPDVWWVRSSVGYELSYGKEGELWRLDKIVPIYHPEL
jgi:hypothetical protein